jgi:hypothetical protein
LCKIFLSFQSRDFQRQLSPWTFFFCCPLRLLFFSSSSYSSIKFFTFLIPSFRSFSYFITLRMLLNQIFACVCVLQMIEIEKFLLPLPFLSLSECPYWNANSSLLVGQELPQLIHNIYDMIFVTCHEIIQVFLFCCLYLDKKSHSAVSEPKQKQKIHRLRVSLTNSRIINVCKNMIFIIMRRLQLLMFLFHHTHYRFARSDNELYSI